MRRKICVVTGTRAEYGLLFWLMKFLSEDEEIHFQLVVTGMHLSPEFGLTYKEIEKAGFRIDKKIEILLSSDSPVGISKSIGLAQISFAEAFEDLHPDIIVLLGDRFEIFAAASSAVVGNFPIAHIHGGETTEGATDEAFRHSITKISHLHFTATDEYKKRVIQLGEVPERVFNLGSPGLDNITRLSLLEKDDFEKSIDFKLNKRNVLITFHPVTLENNTAAIQFDQILQALENLEDTNFIFTKPNSDANGRIIIQKIDEYVEGNREKACAFTSLGQLRYLSALKHVDVVLGNSSSGLSEAPSFGVATINIGDRQKGRIQAESVINCDPEKESIREGLKMAFSASFRKKIKSVKNPYGEGGASEKIADVLKTYDLSQILKKNFFNIPHKY